jgi:hypothetical protein
MHYLIRYMGENDIVITFEKDEIKPKEEVNGIIKINYRGRFDTVVLNSQIQNTSDIFTFIKLNDKKINYSFARMPILKQDIKNVNEISFTAVTEHVPEKLSNVKFRASIIQEHKEVADVVAFLRIIP